MMRRSAGFHADEARRQLLKEWQNVPALELTANDYITCRVNCVDLKNRLSDIETNCRDRLHVWLLRIVGASTAPTSMALPCRWRSRPQHQKQTSELLHSITSSARSRNDSGMARPSALRLMTRSNLLACSTGMSAGLAPQDFIGEVGGAPIRVRDVWSIGHQAARIDILPNAVHRWQSCSQRQGVDADAAAVCKRVGRDIKRIRAAFGPFEGRPDILGSPDFQDDGFQADHADRCLSLAHGQHGARIADVG